MKHRTETRDAIVSAVEQAGLTLSARQTDGLALHLDLVLAANTTQNLTTITERHQAAELHVVDSLLALPELATALPGPFADIGSGAGYPGVPLAIVSGRPATLIESVGKKARFLRDVADALAHYCHLSVVESRAELAATEAHEGFSAVTARALSGLPSLVELASPLLVTGGRLIALKGQLAEEEIQRGKAAAGMVGMEFVRTCEVTLPGHQRAIAVFRRTGRLPETSVPRRPGRAQRKPLA